MFWLCIFAYELPYSIFVRDPQLNKWLDDVTIENKHSENYTEFMYYDKISNKDYSKLIEIENYEPMIQLYKLFKLIT